MRLFNQCTFSGNYSEGRFAGIGKRDSEYLRRANLVFLRVLLSTFQQYVQRMTVVAISDHSDN